MSKRVQDFRPARRNANKHTARGMGALQQSIQTDGWIGAMTTAADGEMIAGSARIETAAQVFGVDAEPIVVESDGTRPVVVVRKDIPTADDPRAQRLAIADNRVAELDLTWDMEVIAGLDADTLGDLWTPEELEQLGEMPTNEDWGASFGNLPEGERAPFQQMTFTVSDEQAEQIKAALVEAKKAGPFVDTGNENSNGNALARICETYLTDGR